MFYTFNQDVFLVQGKSRSCIYDLKHSKLYSINNLLAQKIKEINEGKIKENNIDCKLRVPIDYFVEQGLLNLTNNPDSHYIEEIKENNKTLKFAWIEITNKCNLKCKHCYNESDVQCENRMSLQNFKKIIDILVDMKVPKIQIIGGEPFFDKKILKEMTDYVISKFEYVEIFTNGTLLDDAWYEYLKKNKFHIALSVYSYDEKEHDKVTGVSGSWKKTNETIKKLKSNNIPYRVCNVLMKDVCLGEKTNDLYTLSKEKDIVRMSGRGNFSLLSDELILKKLITKKTFAKPVNKLFCQRLVSGHNCFRDKIYISADLQVFPCVMERRVKHGVINNGKITLNDKIRYFSKDKIGQCSVCEYRYACFDCRPDSISGDFYEKPWYCTYDPNSGEWENEKQFIKKLKSEIN